MQRTMTDLDIDHGLFSDLVEANLEPVWFNGGGWRFHSWARSVTCLVEVGTRSSFALIVTRECVGIGLSPKSSLLLSTSPTLPYEPNLAIDFTEYGRGFGVSVSFVVSLEF